MPQTNEKISVIIPTYNRSKQLEACLSAIAKQDYKDIFELVIVDDGSKDDTKERVSLFSEKNKDRINIKYIYQKNQGCAAARNTGIKHASGDYLFFTDDDCIVPENWITRILEGFKKYPDASAVGGWYEADSESLQKNRFLQVFHQSQRAYFEDYENYEFVFSAMFRSGFCENSVCYKKEIFERIGLFDAQITNASRIDWEFKIRVYYSGSQSVYIPLIITRKRTMNWFGFLQKAFRYGQADYYLSTRFVGYGRSMGSLSNVFFNVGWIKKKFQHSSMRYQMIFFLFKMLGTKFATIKSIVVFTKKHTDMFSFERENIHTKEKEFGTYLDGDAYLHSDNLMVLRGKAISLLKQEYQKPLISIIVPFYNRPEYVNEALVKNFNALTCSDSAAELIFIDDGSTDNTLLKLQQSVSKFRFKTRVLTKKNGGPASARNMGLREAQGEYVFMTDSDVAVPKYWLREFLTAFLYTPEVVLVGGLQIRRNQVTVFDKWHDAGKTGNDYYKMLFVTNSSLVEKLLPCDSANMAIRNGNNLFFDEEVFACLGYEDIDFVYSIKKQHKLVCFVPFPVYNLRHMYYEDYKKWLVARSTGYKIFIDKHRDNRFYYNVYDVFERLFGEGNYTEKFLEMRKLKKFLESHE